MAKFNASQLITQRQQVSLLVRKALTDRAREFNIILDDVAITELSFGRDYAAAVEAKQVKIVIAEKTALWKTATISRGGQLTKFKCTISVLETCCKRY